MLNKVMIIGRLGRDPELRYTQSGVPMTNLNIATDESYTDREGNRVEKTEWHRVVVSQRQAENCASYLGKGSLVYVEGSLQTRKWQDQQGQDRYTTEIRAQRVQFLDRKGDRGQGAVGEGGEGAQGAWRENRAPRENAPRRDTRAQPRGDEDMGPAFPSEAGMRDNPRSSMDDEVPF